MNFGNSITDGEKVGMGKYGFIVSFDLSKVLVDHVKQIVIRKPSGELGRPITKPVIIEKLLSFPSMSKSPDIAYAQQGNIVFIFLKSSSYSYDSGYRIGFSWIRKSIPVKKLTDYVDIPHGTEILMSALLLKKMYEAKNEPVPSWVLNKIRSECKRLDLKIPENPSDWISKNIKKKTLISHRKVISKKEIPYNRTTINRRTRIEREELYPQIIEELHCVYDGGGFNEQQTYEQVSKNSEKLFGRYFTKGSLRGIFQREKEKFREE